MPTITPKRALGFFACFFLIVLVYGTNWLYATYTQPEKISRTLSAHEQDTTNPAFPVRLKIPSIGVDAAIEYVGITSEGEMAVPQTTVDVGWFNLGPRPGEKGSAVIAGHFNGDHGEAGVFTDLHTLKEGDTIYVENDDTTSSTFIVRESRTYDPGYADEVFSRNDGTYLNLVTCNGIWDKTQQRYSKRLVVFADIAP